MELEKKINRGYKRMSIFMFIWQILYLLITVPFMFLVRSEYLPIFSVSFLVWVCLGIWVSPKAVSIWENKFQKHE